MRTEKEIMDLLINTALADERIRAVYMNGSRTNTNVPKDIFQDYDVVYVVRETKFFYEDEHWIDRFGEILYMQMPDKMDRLRGRECFWENTYGWLMLFTDGNRIDLHVSSIEFALQDILTDKLCKILLDKDHVLPEMPEPTDADYYVKKPSEADFQCDCNNFRWCMNNVAKGLWREEVPYVMDMLNYEIRPLLINVLSWKIGMRENFTCSMGKSGKYMYRYLTEDTWEAFLSTYPDAKIEHIWSAVFKMCDLFEAAAREVAEELKFWYNQAEAGAAGDYLRHVWKLPKDSKEIYEANVGGKYE